MVTRKGRTPMVMERRENTRGAIRRRRKGLASQASVSIQGEGDVISLDLNLEHLGVEDGVDVAFAGLQVEAVTVVRAFDTDTIQGSTYQWRGVFVRAGIQYGVILVIDIEQGDAIAVDIHPFSLAGGNVAGFGDHCKFGFH